MTENSQVPCGTVYVTSAGDTVNLQAVAFRCRAGKVLYRGSWSPYPVDAGAGTSRRSSVGASNASVGVASRMHALGKDS